LPREVETPDDVIAELDHCGIDEALVYHRDAFERDFNLGNERLAILDAYPRLHKAMTFVPTCCPEMPSAEDFFKQLQLTGTRAVRAFPLSHKYCLDPVACGDLLDLFGAYSVPVLIPLSEVPGVYQGVYDLMRNFPHLPLVLTETGCWGEDRFFRPLMRAYSRFFVSTNRLETAGQLKGIVDDLGHEHLVFASGLPRNYPGGYLTMLFRADIGDEAREAIAYRNIERVCEEVPW